MYVNVAPKEKMVSLIEKMETVNALGKEVVSVRALARQFKTGKIPAKE